MKGIREAHIERGPVDMPAFSREGGGRKAYDERW